MANVPNYPALRPSLLLDFANSGRLDPRLSFYRPSLDICVGPDGSLRVLPTNVPSIEYDPGTGRALGLFSGGVRSNLLAASERMWDPVYWTVGASLGGGAFAAVAESYDVADIYGSTGPAAKFTMVSANAIFARYPIGLGVGVKFVSIFLYVPAQSGVSDYTFVTDFNDTDTASAEPSTVFGRWIRRVVKVSAVGSRSFVDFNVYVGGSPAPVGFVFYAMGAQLTEWESDAPYIKTTTGAAARAADLGAIDPGVFTSVFDPKEWAMVLTTEKSSLALGQWPRYISISDGTSDNEISVVDQGAGGISVSARANENLVGEVGISVAGTFTLACSFKDLQLRISCNGGPIAAANLSSIPAANQLSIGSPIGQNVDAAIARIGFYSRGLTDLQLQALSA